MPYRLSVNSEEEHARFDLSGTLSEAEIHSAIEELQVIRESQGIRHVLCDQRDLRVPPNDFIGLLTAEQLSSGPFVGLKLAIIRPDTTETRLFEIAAKNRGTFVEIFDDEEEARIWLRMLSQSASPSAPGA